ncbi:MAG: nucleotide-binding protein [Betaproteobacteria bacterium]|nr:nucleotide-binding protein [Betaproteobacteria bacterium]
MKALLALCLFIAAPLVFAGETAATVKGVVLETLNSGGYTYLRLKTKEGETWAAVNRAQVAKGAEVTIESAMVMENFESKSLKKTFPKIVFGAVAGAGKLAPGAGLPVGRTGANKPVEVADVAVPKAVGANARTVAEIVTRGAELKDKPVQVRGKVVKYNSGILGRNWVHLRDGSGSAADGSNDVLVTTASHAKPGDVVTASGTVRINKDFGAGYAYKVMIEEASLQP